MADRHREPGSGTLLAELSPAVPEANTTPRILLMSQTNRCSFI